MNIFAFSDNPHTSALWLDDVRKNKMVLESAQMLSTAIHLLHPSNRFDIYKSTHPNHPCNVWVRQSKANFKWLLQHMIALHKQRKRQHKSALLIPVFKNYLQSGGFPQKELTPFANCARRADMGIDMSGVSDTHLAYRLYIIERWKQDTRHPSWKHGDKPKWSRKEIP